MFSSVPNVQRGTTQPLSRGWLEGLVDLSSSANFHAPHTYILEFVACGWFKTRRFNSRVSMSVHDHPE